MRVAPKTSFGRAVMLASLVFATGLWVHIYFFREQTYAPNLSMSAYREDGKIKIALVNFIETQSQFGGQNCPQGGQDLVWWQGGNLFAACAFDGITIKDLEDEKWAVTIADWQWKLIRTRHATLPYLVAAGMGAVLAAAIYAIRSAVHWIGRGEQ